MVSHDDVARRLNRAQSEGSQKPSKAKPTTVASFTTTPTDGGVLAFTNPGAGSYPYTTFSFPVSVATSVSGTTLDAVVILFDATGTVVDVSNVDRVTVQ